MDPHNHPDRYILSPDLDDSDESVNYLRRLKGKHGASVDHAKVGTGSGTLTASKAAVALPAIGAASPFTERRKAPRFSCAGRIEMRVEGADYRMGGTLTDISLHGCYVEMNNTYPVGTKLNLELEVISIKVRLPGVVRASYPFLGMGISFGEIERKPLAQLQDFSGRSLPAKPMALRGSERTDLRSVRRNKLQTKKSRPGSALTSPGESRD